MEPDESNGMNLRQSSRVSGLPLVLIKGRVVLGCCICEESDIVGHCW